MLFLIEHKKSRAEYTGLYKTRVLHELSCVGMFMRFSGFGNVLRLDKHASNSIDIYLDKGYVFK